MANAMPELDLWYEPSPFQNSQAYEQKNHNWDVLRNYGKYISKYIDGLTDGFDARFSAQIDQVKQPDEVVDARVDHWGKTWPTLHDHLAEIETDQVSYVEDMTGVDKNAPAIILQIDDLSTTSAGMKYSLDGGTAKFEMPRAGLMECQISDININPD